MMHSKFLIPYYWFVILSKQNLDHFVSLKPCHLTLFQTVDRFSKKSGPRLTPPRLLLPGLWKEKIKLSSTAPNPPEVTRDYQDPTISCVLE